MDISGSSKVRLSYEYSASDFDDRLAHEKDGTFNASGRNVEYVYHDIGLRLENKISRNYTVYLDYNHVTRSDEYVGYYEYDMDKYGVKVIGVNIDAIERGEDRIAFKETMNRLGIEMPKSEPSYNVEDAIRLSQDETPVDLKAQTPHYVAVYPSEGEAYFLTLESEEVALLQSLEREQNIMTAIEAWIEKESDALQHLNDSNQPQA